MSNSLEVYTALKNKAEKARREADRAQGAYENTLFELSKDHNCGSIKEAKALLEKLKSELATKKSKFDSKVKTFQEKWKNELERDVDSTD